MKAEELMIGNWVRCTDPTPFKIKAISTIDNSEIVTGNDGFDVNIADLYPIPLTPEILEKNGFKDDGYLFLDIDDFIYLEYYPFKHRLQKVWHGVDEWENHSETKHITFQCTCYYVHELQNALTLCKIDKDIEL